ncbi:glycosyl hydrolase [Granulicella sibirica]|nr:glycosyl hydrolase [Granulicella sibirica]
MRFALCIAAVLLASRFAHGQIDLEESHVTTSLRGVDTAGTGVAWASGSGGTVLRTEDAGFLWQPCTTPKGAEKLDFRGVQALDGNTAVVMSSGSGELSKIYKTTDGCQTWKLVFTNPDKEGFFDTIRRVGEREFYVLGDPVRGRFVLFVSKDGGESWSGVNDAGLAAEKGDGAFAASNTSLIVSGGTLYFGTGGTGVPHVYARRSSAWSKADVPLASYSTAAGVFSIAARTDAKSTLIAVGGVYSKPDIGAGTAATSVDGGKTWRGADMSPGGYRSGVAYDRDAKVWVAVGTNGTDFSRDDGKTWKPLVPTAADAPDVAKGWNAVALPYVVGAKGRIGRVRPDAFGK